MDPHAFVAAANDYASMIAALTEASRADTLQDAALRVEAARKALSEARSTPGWIEVRILTDALADAGATTIGEITSRWPEVADPDMWEELTGQEFPWIW
jgi:hypothetical protein